MRRTLKLLLVIGLAFAFRRTPGGDPPDNGDGPDGTGDSNDPDSTTPDGIDAGSDWGAAKDATKKKAEAGRASDADGDGTPDLPQDPSAPKPSDSVTIDPKKLNKKFKHADDFGIDGNNNHANREKFKEAITDHIDAPGTQRIEGTYRGDPVIHYVDPNTGRNVMTDRDGNFLSAWKLNDAQLENVTDRGSL